MQLAHASVKFPKLMPDGMPTLALGSATNASVAATPEDWFKLRLPLLLNPVPADARGGGVESDGGGAGARRQHEEGHPGESTRLGLRRPSFISLSPLLCWY